MGLGGLPYAPAPPRPDRRGGSILERLLAEVKFPMVPLEASMFSLFLFPRFLGFPTGDFGGRRIFKLPI